MWSKLTVVFAEDAIIFQLVRPNLESMFSKLFLIRHRHLANSTSVLNVVMMDVVMLNVVAPVIDAMAKKLVRFTLTKYFGVSSIISLPIDGGNLWLTHK